MRAYVGANIVVRHFTGDPPDQAALATAFLASADELFLTDIVVAEAVFVLESYYGVTRTRVAELVRALLTYPAVTAADVNVLLRSLEIYEAQQLDFADAYLVASAEASGVGVVASFDPGVDRVAGIRRFEPREGPGLASSVS